jgi:chromatin segregation and condensation protein Rec8/ScpA/Scc1 (kleisin family)
MASLREHDDDDEPGREYDDELLTDISVDERIADAHQDEDEEHRRIRRIKNAKHAKCRQNAEAHAWNPAHRRNLNDAFAAADDRQYNMPIGNIAEVALLIQRLPQNLETKRLLQLTQRAIV